MGSSHATSQQSRPMISTWISWPLTRFIDWSIPSQWIAGWLLNFDLPAKCFRHSHRPSALGSPVATHAQQKVERNRNLSRGCLIFTLQWQDAVCQLEGWSYEPLSNQISVKWHQIDMQRHTSTKIIGWKKKSLRYKHKTLIFKCLTWWVFFFFTGTQ